MEEQALQEALKRFRPGDKFLYKTKYGGFTYGEVERVFILSRGAISKHSRNIEYVPMIRSTKSINYEMDVIELQSTENRVFKIRFPKIK